ncbi:hypothetical protein [Alkalicoccobacillus murimartini]|uniref:Uncharacterized protein n=1 Tax=Alkalicoccobacillus murimartini TaxID=171685 RepID=A0ABT9YG93_9BACI|nr:hypothetical protein [Alkalicoccobacillus murimartini]MDQ0206084.1 hypothetical protein [Alkalicoccobacillus murimartini]
MHQMDRLKEEQEMFLRRGNLLWEGSRMMLPEHKKEIRSQTNETNVVRSTILILMSYRRSVTLL